MKKKDDFDFVIVREVGVIRESSKGWTKRVNLISYNGKEPVIDLRVWSPEGKMTKGITFRIEEKEKVIELLEKIEK